MPANVTIHADLSQFHKQLQRMIIARKKDAATELNRRVIQVLIGSKGFQGAVHLTKKATPARIKADLNRKYHVAGRLKRSKSGKVTASGSDVKLLFILASKKIRKEGTGKGLSFAAYRAHVATVAKLIADARDRSRAYLAAGWLNCVRDLEKRTPGLQMSGKATRGVQINHGATGKSGSVPASRSRASGATPNMLSAICYNAAAEPGTPAGAIVEAGLELGISEQIRDMEKYFQDKLEKSAKKYADK